MTVQGLAYSSCLINWLKKFCAQLGQEETQALPLVAPG